MNKIIFLRTAWMIDYKGVSKYDLPYGAGSYVKQNNDGGEVCNFLSVDGKCYGFARIKNGNDLRIQRLGASKNDDKVENVTVVFFATDPYLGGQKVVGWYNNATLYRTVQKLPNNKRKGHKYYISKTNKDNGTLLETKYRNFEIPADGPGQTNAWYVMEYKHSIKFLTKFLTFKKSFKNYRSHSQKVKSGGKGWQLDAEIRKQVENKAMNEVEKHFVEKGFLVSYVHRENKGWDLEAVKAKATLLLEVKGTIGNLNSALFTPNEYTQSKKLKNYRICIVENALQNKRKLHVLRKLGKDGTWISNTGITFTMDKITSGQLNILH
jgi:hypothetical protein